MTRPTLTETQRRAALKRASASSGRASPKHTYLIEGEYVTSAQIAERLGLSTSTAEGRFRRARKMEGPVTWDRLRGMGS